MRESKVGAQRYFTLFILLAVSYVQAQENRRFPQHLLGIYQPNDPALDFKLDMEKRMGVYLTHPPRRHVSEKVDYQKNVVNINVWQSVKGFSNEELQCRALDWLVFGRTDYVLGARGVLSDYPKIIAVKLIFFDVVRPKNSRRKSKVNENILSYLKVSLTRNHLKTFDPNSLKSALSRRDCNRLFSREFEGRIDNRTVKRLRKAR